LIGIGRKNTKTGDDSKARRVLLTVLVVGVLGTVAGFGVFAAFTATTTNPGNQIDSGTVAISDNDLGVALYNVTNAKPGEATSKCIRVSYTGSLASSVKLYVSSGITNGTLYNLKVERGSGTTDFNACTGFTASSTAYNAALGSFGTNYDAGVDGKAAGAAWNKDDTVDYRFTITLNDDTTPNAHTSVTSSGAHTFTWEARNN
jgi:hypothetical protein